MADLNQAAAEDVGGEMQNISEMKKTIEIHIIVAALIATVTFAAGFTLPGGYIQNESNDQGMAVFSLPTKGTMGKVQLTFNFFVVADSIALGLSLCAIAIYFLASFPDRSRRTVWIALVLGYLLNMLAMMATMLAFVAALITVLHPCPKLKEAVAILFTVFMTFLFAVLVSNLGQCKNL